MDKNKIIFLVTFLSICFIFLFKLDYQYFFTDEILYIDSGREHLKGLYGSVMEVPLPSKYLAAISYKNFDHDVSLVRLPFAILGILTSLMIFKILQKQYGFIWGVVGMTLFTSSNIITFASRMVMLEPLLHFCWAVFLYFYFESITKNKTRYYLLSGLFFGLSLASKFTSIILIPFILFFAPYVIYMNRKNWIRTVLNYFGLFFSGGGVFVLTYIDPMLKYGKRFLYDVVYNEVYEIYFLKSEIGKKHVVAGEVYTKSPYWTYGYFLITKEWLVTTFIYIFGSMYSLFNRNLFIVYYLMFFALSFTFHQIFGVKSLRYTSSFLIPLVILSTSGLYYFVKKYSNYKKYIFILIAIIFLLRILDSVLAKRTEYSGLFEEYLRKETNNFSNNKKIYIFGSTRSSRWYKHGKAEGKEMFEISGNLIGNCNRFKDFDYLVIEKEQLKVGGENKMSEHAAANLRNYELNSEFGFLIYKKISNENWVDVCQTQNLVK